MKLHSLISDHMVIQRNSPITIRGEGQKDEQIQVELNSELAKATVDERGQWEVRLPGIGAGGPYALKISSSTGQQQVIRDVMIGEVWFASGQSNMEWKLSQIGNPQKNDGPCADPNLRFFNVPRCIAKDPQSYVNGSWQCVTEETAPDCSAVAFYFGQKLRKELHVPVGLINSSYGGTPAESWMPYETLQEEPDLKYLLDLLGPNKEYVQPDKPLVGDPVLVEKWLSQQKFKDPGITSFAKNWADPELNETWNEMDLPCYWNDGGQDLNGVLWFRRVVDLPAAWAGKKLVLNLGAIDKSDATFFNGTKIGGLSIEENPNAWSTLRRYEVPADLVKKGKNVIAVRNFSHIYHGGLTGPKSNMRLELSKEEFIELHGKWSYKVEQNFGKFRTMAQNFRSPSGLPTVLYNGMIAPLHFYPIRGVIWYQGESNAARSVEYEHLFKKLILEWRKRWNLEKFPFYFVQLANYNLGNNQWARLRESQRRTLELPETGMAVAIDIGDPQDIHPRNKKDVGLRLANWALHFTYQKMEAIPSGPLFKSAKRQNGSIQIEFDYAEGLKIKGPKLKEFTVSENGREYIPATPIIEGNRLKLQISDCRISKPRFLRYGWADNPDCNLFNGADLPASPFEAEIEFES